MQRHLRGGDAPDPEPVEERPAFLTVFGDEQVVGRLPAERAGAGAAVWREPSDDEPRDARPEA